MNRSPQARAIAGFTLLEAIVAMTIFVMTALALFAWQSTNLRSLERIESRAAYAQQVQSALAMVETVNPMIEPKGERPLGQKKVRWEAKEIEPAKSGRTTTGQPSLFDVGLYDVAVKVEQGNRILASFHVRLMGYRQTRFVEEE